MALVMITCVTPATGVLMADETETDKPVATESFETTEPEMTEKPAPKEAEKAADETVKDTEAPKETEVPSSEPAEETEAPATEVPSTKTPEQTEKPEATVPEETDKPAAKEPKEAEAPSETTPEESGKPDKSKTKIPDDTVSQAPRNAHLIVGEINATIKDGVLTWEPYNNAVNYTFRISEARSSMDYSNNERKIDLKEWIDGDIEWGLVDNLGSYTLRLTAYDSDDKLIAEWSDTFIYNSEATLQEQVGQIKDLKVTNDILTWKSYPGADEYYIMINGVTKAWYSEPLDFSDHRSIYDLIDEAIYEGEIEKKSPYMVRVVAFCTEEDAVGTLILPYDSKADRLKYAFDSINISDDSIMSWDEIPGADCYGVHIDYDDGKDITGNWADDNLVIRHINLNEAITEMISDGRLTIPDYCKLTIDLYAWDKDCNIIAFESTIFLYNTLTPNPLSVKGKTAKVKYKKLRKKKQRLAVSKVISGIKTGKGRLTFTKVSGNKKISINKSTGKVTIKKKGLKKRKTYKVTVKIRASGDSTYAPVETKVTFRIKVK